MGVVKFCIGALLLAVVCQKSEGVYEHNPFLSQVVPPVPTVVNPPPQSNQEVTSPPSNPSYQPGIFVNPPSYYPQAPIIPQQPPSIVTQSPLLPVQPPVQQPGEDLQKRCASPTGRFASSKCNKFVNCWNYIAIEQFCPPGSAFNSFEGYCDHINNVNCQGRSFEEIPGAQPAAPEVAPLVSVTDPNLRKRCLGSSGVFPSSYCNRYVNCWHENAIEQDCPPGLMFSDQGYCDYAYNVNCNGRAISTTPAQQPPASTNVPVTIKPQPPYGPPINRPPSPAVDGITAPPQYVTPTPPQDVDKLRKKCKGAHGLFPSDYCNKFVNCWDTFAVEQDCPPGLLFSENGYCDYPYNVNCYNRTIVAISVPQPPASATPPTNEQQNLGSTVPTVPTVPSFKPPNLPIFTLPTQKPTEQTPVASGVIPDEKLQKKCLKPRGQFPSDICNRYVNCWDGFVVEQDCPLGLLFSSDKGYCDYPYNVKCYNRTVITVSYPQQPLSPTNGLPIYEVETQKPQVPVTETLPPYIPTLPPGAVDGDVTQRPAVVVPTFPAYVPPVVLPVNEGVRSKCLKLRGQFPTDSCHKYIDCWDQLAIEHDCPQGLLFSEKGYCDYPANVNCNNRTYIKSAPSPSCPSAHGTFRDKTNCSRYYTCSDNSVAIQYECPLGLYYSEIIGVCDYPYRVDCATGSSVLQPFKQTNYIQQIPAAMLDIRVDCTPGKVFKLNPECTSAAVCRNTVTEIVHCPVGLAYDAPSDRCLHFHTARCQGV